MLPEYTFNEALGMIILSSCSQIFISHQGQIIVLGETVMPSYGALVARNASQLL